MTQVWWWARMADAGALGAFSAQPRETGAEIAVPGGLDVVVCVAEAIGETLFQHGEFGAGLALLL